MIDNDRDNKVTKETHTENLYRVVQFCENQSECRRVQLLGYFGETDFTSDQCRNGNSACDNCQSSQSFENKDVNEDAKAIVQAVNSIVHKGNRNFRRPLAQVTLNHMVDIFKGSENARVVQGGHNTCAMFGRGRDYHRNDAERLARMLVLRHILDENIVIGHHDNAICYVKLGSKAVAFLQGHIKLEPFATRPEGRSSAGSGQKASGGGKRKRQAKDQITTAATSGSTSYQEMDCPAVDLEEQSVYWKQATGARNSWGGGSKNPRKPRARKSYSKGKSSYTVQTSASTTRALQSCKYQKKKQLKGRDSANSAGGLRLMALPRPRDNPVSVRRTGQVRPELGW